MQITRPKLSPRPGLAGFAAAGAVMVVLLVGCERGPAPSAPPPPDPLAGAVAAIANAPQTPAPTPSASQSKPSPSPTVIKAEVLLARAHASPGVIDGLPGSNLERAVAAFETMNGLPADGQLNPTVWSRLSAVSGAPVAGVYVETAADVAGPFYPDVGEDMVAASKLASPGYSSPLEALAARFHMSQDLLSALNPGRDFKTAGERLVVALPDVPALAPVASVQVDKAKASAVAFDAQGHMIASFPATVGSTEKPSPTGVHKVVGVSFNPTYTYDPAKLTWGPKRHGRFTIKPGPNNPVGLVWIALNAPGYGVHGSPDPDKIGKTASHGCVRLTNWDAVLLAHAVKPGVTVTFVHARDDADAKSG
jgi:lipoprotein-anchoring transpeptidase ErfK/SrfK